MESLPVPSMQAMVAATGGADVPPRYLRPEAAVDAVAGDSEAQISIIDYRRLLLEDHGEESVRLHRACQDWGFFQLINHGVPDDVVEGMKASIQEFFQLPAETKKQFAQPRGLLEGYGQLFVVSEDQKLDWADILYLNTQPPEDRNTRFWPDQPASFRSDCDCSLPILTNGRYRSIEHRAVVDPKEERLSVTAFHSPSIHTMIGPLKEIAAHEDEAYKTVDHQEFMKLFFSAKLEGKSFLDRMKLKSS